MARAQDGGWRRRWWITLTVALGVALPVVVGALGVDRVEERALRAQTELHADHLVSRIESALAQRVRLLRDLAADLGDGDVVDRHAFATRARATAAALPDVQAVNWLDPEGVARWVEPIEDNAPVAGLNIGETTTGGPLLAKARALGRPTSTGLVPLVQGGQGFATYFPVGGARGGYVNGVFLIDDLIAQWLSPEMGRTIRVELGGDLDPRAETLRVERALAILGEPITLSVEPTPLAAAQHRRFATLLLGFGLLLAALIALLTHAVLTSRENASTEKTHRLALLAAVPDHMVRLDAELNLLAYHRAPGLAPLPSRLPVRRWLPPRLRAAIERAWAEGDIVDTEVELEGRQYAARVAPGPGEHAVVGLRDITERRRLEEERNLLAELVRASGQLAAVLDQDGQIAYLNPAGRAMLALEDPEPAPIEDFLDTPPQLAQALVGGPAWSGRVELRARDGQRRPVQLAAFPISTQAGPKLGLLGHDLTPTVELERQLLQSQKLEAMGALAAGVAHDFNNSLTVFQTGLEMLETTPDLPEAVTEDLALMRSATFSARQIAHQLLAFSRPGQEQDEVFAVDETLASCTLMFRRVVPESVELAWDLRAPEAHLRGSPAAVQQIILNLVSNARDAVEEGGEIRITTAPGASPKGTPEVLVAVVDDGGGMSPGQLERVFEPFFTTKPSGRGTGLGLAMVKRVTEDLGGAVAVESTPGRGTKVSLRFPVVGRGASPRGPSVTTQRRLRRHRVVLADDDRTLRAMVARSLEREGWEVAQATTGWEALEHLREPADALVSDVGMPGLDGIELARRVLTEHPGLPVMLISGRAEHAEAARALGPAVEFLSKPVTTGDLVARIDARPPLVMPPPSASSSHTG